jgi:putative ABC transport system ATP-binding protein
MTTTFASHRGNPPPTGLDAVTLDGISKSYKSKGGTVHALRGITHTFRGSTFTAVMGPSGSGKSTLLQCAAGLDRPTGGNVLLGGTRLGSLNEVALTKLRRSTMGFVFQSYNLLGALTVFDNVGARCWTPSPK